MLTGTAAALEAWIPSESLISSAEAVAAMLILRYFLGSPFPVLRLLADQGTRFEALSSSAWLGEK